jgi:hypothetical protein
MADVEPHAVLNNFAHLRQDAAAAVENAIRVSVKRMRDHIPFLELLEDVW